MEQDVTLIARYIAAYIRETTANNETLDAVKDFRESAGALRRVHPELKGKIDRELFEWCQTRDRLPSAGELRGVGSNLDTGEIEVRDVTLLDGSRVLDEVVGEGVDFHLEQLDDNHWWMAITGSSRTIVVVLYTKRAKIKATWEEEP